jgi:hypothetical protein
MPAIVGVNTQDATFELTLAAEHPVIEFEFEVYATEPVAFVTVPGTKLSCNVTVSPKTNLSTDRLKVAVGFPLLGVIESEEIEVEVST